MREAHIAGLELQLDLRRLQAQAGLNAIVGHAMFARFDEGQAQLSAAIDKAATGHKMALVLAPHAGVDAGYGETTDPSGIADERTTARLTAVA